MAQFYKVSKAFQATDRDTKQPVTDQHGNGKWMFQVEGQGPEGWMSVNKKAGTELKVGDYVYGIVDTWPEGKAKFVRQQVPEGTPYPSDGGPSAPQQTPQRGTSVDSKLDYIISLLENRAQFQNNEQPGSQGGSKGPEDFDDGPVDLSQIDY